MPPLLIDVRSPGEYATGSHSGAINIEYTTISILASRPDLLKDDPITLYCRSGRRSAIALGELRGLGFTKVRDIGDFESAGEVLRRERLGRESSGGGAKSGEEEEGGEASEAARTSMAALGRSYAELMAGLQGPQDDAATTA